MGEIREVDALSDAIIETEREIAGEAWGQEDTERADASGDRSLEAMGEGLEGQHEATEDEDAEGSEEQDEGEESEEGEGEDGEDGEGEEASEAPAATTGKKPEGKPDGQEQQQGRVPSGKLREAAERARVAEAERDALKAQLEAAKREDARVAALEAQIAQLQRQSPPAPKEEPKVEQVPDIFEDPKGYADYMARRLDQSVATVRQDMRKQAVETSFALAHGTHKEAFTKAYEAVNGLNPQDPNDRATVQRIYNSANPGEELVRWYNRNEALRRVGDDPTAYEARIREETRQALLKDPEFRKALAADMRGEAATGENGAPRTTTRLPRSLARAGGSNLGTERADHDRHDGSEQAVADAAWR